MDDIDLLHQYARDGSQSAMAKLVGRHLDLVYASAVRRLGGDRAAAEDVAQGVFIILARKANSISSGTHLSAWLLRTTRYVAANAQRLAEIRRRHERAAGSEQMTSRTGNQNESDDAQWQQVAPLLDDAVSKLAEGDRRAILLRYFENHSLEEVGEILGTSSDAARKRINRAIDKLRRLFARRGVAIQAAGLISSMGRASEAAPAELRGTVTQMACSTAANLTTNLSPLVEGAMRMIFRKKLRAAIAALALAAVVIGGAGFILSHAGRSSNAIAATRPAGAAGTADESIDRILDRYLDARGGAEKLARIQSIRMSGPLDLGGGGTAQLLTEIRRPDRFRQDFVFNGQTNIRAFDGKTAWYHIPFLGIPQPTVMPADERKSIVEESDLDGPLVDRKAKGNKIELVGREQLDGREYYKLKVTLKNGDVRHHYLDAETMWDVRVEGKQVENGQEVSYVQKLSDFRDVDGVLFPFVSEVQQSSPAGEQRFVYQIETIEANVPMDDAHFIMPATQPATKP